MTWQSEFWHAAILTGGVLVGLVFGLSVIGLAFALAGWISSKRRRKCRHCGFAGPLTEVMTHEELDHAPEGK